MKSPEDDSAKIQPHPYGEVGEPLGIHSRDLLDWLSRPLDAGAHQGGAWHDADAEALAGVIELEWLLPHIRPDERVSTDELETFHLTVTAFRAALPLTHAERHWLVKEIGAVDPHYEAVEKAIGSRNEEVVAEGRSQFIRGSELLRRWLAWRRENQEYAKHGALNLAREALRGMVELLAPEEPLPESYRKLRGL